MLNLQEAKVLSALIQNHGLTDEFSIPNPRYPSLSNREVIESVGRRIGMAILKDDHVRISDDGTVFIDTIYRLHDSLKIDAAEILEHQIDEFMKAGILFEHFE